MMDFFEADKARKRIERTIGAVTGADREAEIRALLEELIQDSVTLETRLESFEDFVNRTFQEED
jgi:hypothetical protein